MINAPHTTTCECFPINPEWKADIHPGMPGTMRLAIEMLLVRETDKAILMRDPAGRDHWIAKSTANHSRAYKYVKPVYTVILPAWLARKLWK